MYRGELESETDREQSLRVAIAALEGKISALHERRAAFAAFSRWDLLRRWWGIAIVVVSLTIGAAAGRGCGRDHHYRMIQCR